MRRQHRARHQRPAAPAEGPAAGQQRVLVEQPRQCRVAHLDQVELAPLGGGVGHVDIGIRHVERRPGQGYYQHGSSGGGIVDAATVGGEDLIKELQPSIDLAVGAYDELVITEAGDDGAAELVVRGPAVARVQITAALAREPLEIVGEAQ